MRKIFEIRVKNGLISVKFKVYINFSITKGLFIDIFFVLLQWIIVALLQSSRLDVFFHDGIQGSLRCAEYGGVIMTKRYKAGIGWEK